MSASYNYKAKVNYKVSHNIDQSLMSAVVGEIRLPNVIRDFWTETSASLNPLGTK